MAMMQEYEARVNKQFTEFEATVNTKFGALNDQVQAAVEKAIAELRQQVGEEVAGVGVGVSITHRC